MMINSLIHRHVAVVVVFYLLFNLTCKHIIMSFFSLARSHSNNKKKQGVEEIEAEIYSLREEEQEQQRASISFNNIWKIN